MITVEKSDIVSMKKHLNSFCKCNKGLAWIKSQVIMLEPCEHLIHAKCLKKYGIKNNNIIECPYCNIPITHTVQATDYKINPKLYQKCIDILSISNFDNMSKYNPRNIFENFPNLLSTISSLPFTKGKQAGIQLVENIFAMNNIELHVYGLSKIKNEPKVFIVNHTSHLDFLVVFYVLNTGFLTSSGIYENVITSQLAKIMPVLIIDRAKKGNTVEKIKEYVKKQGSICLFPEGLMSHPQTLIRFRTGAFYIGYPVYPIVLTFDPPVADMSTPDFILKMSSNQKIKITMKILDPFYPPFDEDKIELVRLNMANSGNMVISRVSNRDIRDE